MLHQQIKEAVKKAMLEKNPLKLNAVRGLLAACTNELVATHRKPDEMLNDDEVIIVVRHAAKQRQDSIEQFTAGDRQDLVKQESAELEIIKTYLPPELDQKELEKIIAGKIKALGITDKKDAGKLTGAVIKDLKGKVDGNTVKKAIESLLV